MVFLCLFFFLVGRFVYDQMGLVRVFVCFYLALHVLGVDCAIVVYIALKIPRPEFRVVIPFFWNGVNYSGRGMVSDVQCTCVLCF